MTVAVALAPLTIRGQEVESAEGGHYLGRDLRIAPRIDTGLAGTALAVTGRGLLTATDHVDSVLVPPLAEELAVTRSPSSFS